LWQEFQDSILRVLSILPYFYHLSFVFMNYLSLRVASLFVVLLVANRILAQDMAYVGTTPNVTSNVSVPVAEPAGVPSLGATVSAYAAMLSPVNTFFEALEEGNSARMASVCMPTVMLKTHMQDQKGNQIFFDESLQELSSFAATAGNQQVSVRIDYEVAVSEPGDDAIRVPYSFYINDTLSHCGVQSFELKKVQNEWKINQMVDTRARTCTR
jgi:hypothetical protein